MDFKGLLEICKKNSREGDHVLDWIMYYAGEKEKVKKKFDLFAKKYPQIFKVMPEPNYGMFISQYIIHEVFRKGGLLITYLNHSSVKLLPLDHYDYLKKQLDRDWYYCYFAVLDNPQGDFYQAVSVFTQERFLIYSPGMTRTLNDQPVMMFAGLISSNGHCYQSFGPLLGFCSIDPDDIFYYATEWDFSLETDEDIHQYIQDNLLNFILLSNYAHIPLAVHKEHEIMLTRNVMDMEEFSTEGMGKDFIIGFNAGVYRIQLKGYEIFPHFTVAYYDETSKELHCSSMTDEGYKKLSQKLLSYGIPCPPYPDQRIHMTMQTAISEIFKKDILADPYSDLFPEQKESVDPETLNTLNNFIAALVEKFNNNETPDLKKMAIEFGVPLETAKELKKVLEKNTGKRL
jgi:hypothetical protein